ncbi:hypothetical protein TRIUR3_31537 [Triticum urartu]|uniref:Uncharacterized protein n=1 Tax=Triticum urartu TaxID=4572 RepID=M7Z730_TRIUA|nr:hypothetical protein TRIUR3_31537 [Triticum urartu]
MPADLPPEWDAMSTKEQTIWYLASFISRIEGVTVELIAANARLDSAASSSKKPSALVVPSTDLTIDPTSVSFSTAKAPEVLELVHDSSPVCIAMVPVTCSMECSTQVDTIDSIDKVHDAATAVHLEPTVDSIDEVHDVVTPVHLDPTVDPIHQVVELAVDRTIDATVTAVSTDVSFSTFKAPEVLQIVHDASPDCMEMVHVTCSTECSHQVATIGIVNERLTEYHIHEVDQGIKQQPWPPPIRVQIATDDDMQVLGKVVDDDTGSVWWLPDHQPRMEIKLPERHLHTQLQTLFVTSVELQPWPSGQLTFLVSASCSEMISASAHAGTNSRECTIQSALHSSFEQCERRVAWTLGFVRKTSDLRPCLMHKFLFLLSSDTPRAAQLWSELQIVEFSEHQFIIHMHISELASRFCFEKLWSTGDWSHLVLVCTAVRGIPINKKMLETVQIMSILVLWQFWRQEEFKGSGRCRPEQLSVVLGARIQLVVLISFEYRHFKFQPDRILLIRPPAQERTSEVKFPLIMGKCILICLKIQDRIIVTLNILESGTGIYRSGMSWDPGGLALLLLRKLTRRKIFHRGRCAMILVARCVVTSPASTLQPSTIIRAEVISKRAQAMSGMVFSTCSDQEHSQGGRGVSALAVRFAQGSIDHKYYIGFNNDYFIDNSFRWVAIVHYYHVVQVNTTFDCHRLRVQWDPGGRRLPRRSSQPPLRLPPPSSAMGSRRASAWGQADFQGGGDDRSLPYKYMGLPLDVHLGLGHAGLPLLQVPWSRQ